MNEGRTVLSQIIALISIYDFNKCVKCYNGNHRVRSFTRWEKYTEKSFAQLTYR